MSAPTYDKAYFIAKFEATDEDSWCVGKFNKNGKSCALGKCGVKYIIGDNEEANALVMLITSIVHISDGLDPRYPQLTPKQRVLAALRDSP